MLGAIKYNLANLTNFNGRDARQTFWYYVLFLALIQVAVSFLITIPMMTSVFSGAIEAAQSGISEEAMQAQMMAQMGGWFETSMWITLAVSVAMTFLLAAAFVRRIHDSDHSGWWAALAVGAQAISAIYSFLMIDRLAEAMVQSAGATYFDQMFAAETEIVSVSLLGYIPVIIVIVFGVMKSTDGANRFGTQPVRF